MTIGDIAERAGVSKGAVSYALNDQPGVSDATRARVLAIAAEIGWSASHAARSLSTSRADAIGLVLARPARLLGIEPFYMEFISGIEEVLAPLGVALMLHVVPDLDARDRGLPPLVGAGPGRRRHPRRPHRGRPAAG